jgi:CO dehydrogenase maturation factor
MLIKYLVSRGKSPVLAVDADANANLNEILGLEVTDTLGNAREEMKSGTVPSGMTKDVFISMRLEQAIIEQQGFRSGGHGPARGGRLLLCRQHPADRVSGAPFRQLPLSGDGQRGRHGTPQPAHHQEHVDVLLIVTDTSRRGLQAGLAHPPAGQRPEASESGKAYIVINQAKSDPAGAKS